MAASATSPSRIKLSITSADALGYVSKKFVYVSAFAGNGRVCKT